jgi:hypothetical protein
MTSKIQNLERRTETANSVFAQFKDIISEESFNSCKKRLVENLGPFTPSFFNPDYETAIEIITYKENYDRWKDLILLEGGQRCPSACNPEDGAVKRYRIGGREVTLNLSKDFLTNLKKYAEKAAAHFAIKYSGDFGITSIEAKNINSLGYLNRDSNDMKHLRKYITLEALVPFFDEKETSMGPIIKTACDMSWPCYLGELSSLTDYTIDAMNYIIVHRNELGANKKKVVEFAVGTLTDIATYPFDITNPHHFDTNFRRSDIVSKARTILNKLIREDTSYSHINHRESMYDEDLISRQDDKGTPFKDLPDLNRLDLLRTLFTDDSGGWA